MYKNDTRSTSLYKKVYCPVCSGQTIDTSDTKDSIEMRSFIQTAIAQGKTDKEILHTILENYGPEVIRSQEDMDKTFILIPFFLLCIVIITILIYKYIKQKK